MRLRLFYDVFSVETRKLMSYRADFWFNTLVGSAAQFVLAYSLWAAILSEPGQTVEGYSLDGIVLYYVLVILLGRLVSGPQNPTDLAQEVYDGTLSRYLLYPANYFAIKYAQRTGLLVPSLVQAVALGAIYFLFVPLPEGISITPLQVAMGLGSIALANLLYFSLMALVQLVAFWADNVWSLVVMTVFVSRLLGGSWIPLDTFPSAVRPWLRALPFEYLFGFPIDTIMGRVEPSDWLTGCAIALAWILGLGFATRLVWRRGMLQYTGVGI